MGPTTNLRELKLILHGSTVTTIGSLTPGHDRSITKNGSTSVVRGLDLLHVLKLILHGSTDTTIGSMTLGHDRSIAKNGSKSVARGLNLLHVL